MLNNIRIAAKIQFQTHLIHVLLYNDLNLGQCVLDCLY